MNTNVTFSKVKDLVNNNNYSIKNTWQTSKKGDLYVELRGDGGKVTGTGVKQKELYMKNEDEFDKVVDELA